MFFEEPVADCLHCKPETLTVYFLPQSIGYIKLVSVDLSGSDPFSLLHEINSDLIGKQILVTNTLKGYYLLC